MVICSLNYIYFFVLIDYVLFSLQLFFVIKIIRTMIKNERKKKERHQKNDSCGLYLADNQRGFIKEVEKNQQQVNCQTSRRGQPQALKGCPSIDKEFPQFSRVSKISKQSQQVNVIEDFQLELKLKSQAIQNLQNTNKLIADENMELKNTVYELQAILKDKELHIEQLQQELRLAKSEQSSTFIKNIMDQREPSIHRQAHAKVKSKTQLFFSFTQAKEKQLPAKKSQKIIINFDNPTFKQIKGDVTVSKKLSPYTSINLSKQEEESTSSSKIMETISCLLFRQSLECNKGLIQQINQLAYIEQDEQEQLMSELQERIALIEQVQLASEPKESKIQKRLFTLQDQNSITGDKISELIVSYQKCIQNYKEYAAYLKAYLCQCINYLAQIVSLPSIPQKYEPGWITQIIKLVIQDVKENLNFRVKGLEVQNEQLKIILQELIKNIEVSKRQQAGEEWKNCELVMKECQ